MSAVFDPRRISQLYNEISSGLRSMDWFLLGYKPDSTKEIVYIAKGDLGIMEMKNYLSEEMVGFGYIKIPMENPEVFNECDFVHLTFIGKRVKPQERARAVVHRLDIQQELPRFITELYCEGLQEVSKERLEEEVKIVREQLAM